MAGAIHAYSAMIRLRLQEMSHYSRNECLSYRLYNSFTVALAQPSKPM